MRTSIQIASRLALPFLALALLAAPALAADATYVGTWASDPHQCKNAQDSPEAPLVMTNDGYDQHEAHCKFKSVTPGDGEWKIAADCSVEGDTQPMDFTLTVSGDTLTLTDDTGGRDLLRCN